MSEPHDPYLPPKADIQTDLQQPVLARPKIMVVLVCIYLAIFPLFAWRVSLGGKMQTVVLVFWLTVFGLYALGIAFGLLKGKRWARVLVIGFAAANFCVLVVSLFLKAGQADYALELRGQLYVVETLLKVLVATLLLLPISRKWFASLRAAKPT